MNRALLAASVAVGCAIGALAALDEGPVHDGLVGWPTDAPATASAAAAVRQGPLPDPLECAQARAAARSARAVMVSATRRWADELVAARSAEAKRATAVLAAVESMRRDELREAIAGTSLSMETYATALGLEERAAEVCRIGP